MAALMTGLDHLCNLSSVPIRKGEKLTTAYIFALRPRSACRKKQFYEHVELGLRSLVEGQDFWVRQQAMKNPGKKGKSDAFLLLGLEFSQRISSSIPQLSWLSAAVRSEGRWRAGCELGR